MTLRSRLILTLGLALILLWAVAAVWMQQNLHRQMEATLDDRLAQSARMVAGLVSQLPQGALDRGGTGELFIPAIDGLACQVKSARGEVVARTHGDLSGVLEPDGAGYHYREQEGITWRVFAYETQNMTIVTADRAADRNDLVAGVIRVAAVPMMAAIVGSLLFLWLAATSVLHPLNRLRDMLAARDPDALAPVPESGMPPELLPMVQTLNRLLERVNDAFTREKQLTDDAAHELRTPLTVIKTHLQLAAKLDDPHSKQQSIAKAQLGVDRLHRTLEQILTLARVEGGAHFTQGNQEPVAAILQRACEAAGVSEGQVSLSVADALGRRRVAMPAELAVTVVRNLVANALTHGESLQPIRLEVHPQGDAIAITVTDQGPGMAPDKLLSLTDRFWRKGQQEGSGLGLAIVSAILARFNGRLTFSLPEQGGLAATVVLPVTAPGIP
ncbi:MAG: HAMP domain-containing protein [Halomonadaceae bacterium]|nr:MAG: HAMP domain-containing protein [Halomonadaceae bacterium]